MISCTWRGWRQTNYFWIGAKEDGTSWKGCEKKWEGESRLEDESEDW